MINKAKCSKQYIPKHCGAAFLEPMLKWLKEEKEVPIQFKVVTQTSKEQSEILTDMCKKDYDRQQKAFKLEENKRRTERLKIGKDFVAKAPLPPYDPVNENQHLIEEGRVYLHGWGICFLPFVDYDANVFKEHFCCAISSDACGSLIPQGGTFFSLVGLDYSNKIIPFVTLHLLRNEDKEGWQHAYSFLEESIPSLNDAHFVDVKDGQKGMYSACKEYLKGIWDFSCSRHYGENHFPNMADRNTYKEATKTAQKEKCNSLLQKLDPLM